MPKLRLALVISLLNTCILGYTDEFTSYLEAFRAASLKYRGVAASFNTQIYQYPLPKDIEAACVKEKNVILVNELLWNTHSNAFKWLLLLHELGHCVLGRGHKENTVIIDSKTIPASLMRDGGIELSDFMAHEDMYLEELFLFIEN